MTSPLAAEGWLAARPRSREAVELGREGEILAARMRLWAALAASAIPLLGLLRHPRDSEAWIGLGAGAVLVLLGTAVLALGRRPAPPRWLGLASCLLDVTVLSLASAAFVAAGNPLAATNRRVVFSCYFVALSLACLRLDERLCAAAGLAAMLQYGGIVLWAARRFDLGSAAFAGSAYGVFLPSNQWNRLAVLAVATAIDAVVVRRLRGFWEASIRDRLTGLHNRQYAESRLDEAVSVARREGRGLVVAMADLDRFKAINDRHGHAAGDEVLRHAAALLRGSFRASDVVARYGGEEFLIVLPETERDAALDRLRRFHRDFATSPVPLPGTAGEVEPTLSLGVAAYPQDGRTAADLLARADERLYAAKQAGRNRVEA